MWRDTGQLIANPKVSSGRRLQCKLLYTYAHICPLYSVVIAVSIVHVVIHVSLYYPLRALLMATIIKTWRRVWMLSSCPNCE